MRSKTMIWAGCVVALCWFTMAHAAGDRRLVEAVKSRDQKTVRSLLQQHVDVNTPLADGSTPLSWAVHWDDLEPAAALIAAGANVNAANDYGVTPLSLACSKGSVAILEKLLAAKAHPNAATWTGETSLMTCARSGNVQAVKLLLDHGANVNASEQRRGQTSLMWAVAEKHADVARVLIERGADVNARSHRLQGFQPPKYLTYGVYQKVPGQTDTFQAGDVHEDPSSSKGGFTALMFAAQQGDLECMKLLLTSGANVNDSTPDYGNALLVASASGHEQAAIFLLEKGADPNTADGWGFAPLHYALQEGIAAIGRYRPKIPTDQNWLKPNMPQLAKALLEHGANSNARVTKGLPPFDYPAFARTTGNAMPQIRQPGATPFFFAAASLHLDLMRLLLDHGADPLIATQEGTTPLMVAAGVGPQDEYTPEDEKKAWEAVKLIAERGADVGAANRDGRTALHGAAFMGANSIVEFLAGKGANLNAKDMYGQSPLSIAYGDARLAGGDKRFRVPHAHKTTAELLLRLGAAPVPPPAARRASETAVVDANQ